MNATTLDAMRQGRPRPHATAQGGRGLAAWPGINARSILAAAFLLELGWALFAAAFWGVGDRSRPPAPSTPLYAFIWLGGAIAIALVAGLLARRAAPLAAGRD